MGPKCFFSYQQGFDEAKIKSCLETIYDYNVIKFNDGQLGAVNGMRPNGTVDFTSMQSEEVWLGVSDSLSALMLYEVIWYLVLNRPSVLSKPT